MPCSSYSKLARKVNTSFFNVASDASEIMPSFLNKQKECMVRSGDQKVNMASVIIIIFLDDLPDAGQKLLVLAENVLQEGLLEPCDLAGIHLVQMPSDTGVDDRHLLLNGHGAYEDRTASWTLCETNNPKYIL